MEDVMDKAHIYSTLHKNINALQFSSKIKWQKIIT